MKRKLTYLVLILGVFAQASEVSSGSTDILPRTVNFLIFAAILYYLVAEPVKNFFKNRSAEIASKLESVQAKLKEAKQEKERAQKELENAKKLANEIIEDAKKESKLLSEKIKSSLEEELRIMEKTFNENCSLEERQVVRNVVKNILNEILEDKNISINKNEFINLIAKKVA